MGFLNRFSFYFIGVLFGCFILYISLKGRKEPLSFNYFPNSRVKSHLVNSDIVIAEAALCKVNCMNLDTMQLRHYILDCKVDFKKSEIRGHGVKTYYLFYELNKKDVYYFTFQTNGDKVELVDVFINAVPRNTDRYFFEKCKNCF